MIPLRRTEEPRVLRENKKTWLEKFLERRAREPGHRPRSAQYAHEEVKTTLAAMSLGKCFYCEAKPEELEVDHYVEVAEEPEQAFVWGNLYLACKLCQRKATNSAIPVASCLDPCDPAVAPTAHLDFEDECIVPKDGSPVGLSTIQKYRLYRQEHDLRRLRQLKLFLQELDAFQVRALAEGRPMTEAEWSELRRYHGPGHPYSLMFYRYLEKRER